MTKEVSILSMMENPEHTLLELALSIHRDNFKEYKEILPVFTTLVNDKEYYETLSLIKLIVKTIDDEKIEYTSMNLLDVIIKLYHEEKTEDSVALYKCIQEKLPLLTRVLDGSYEGSIVDSNPIPTPTKQKEEIDVKQLIDDHWNYVGGLIEATAYDTENFTLDALEYIYKTSFEHGFKHAIQLNK
jgi:hypothetical protein